VRGGDPPITLELHREGDARQERKVVQALAGLLCAHYLARWQHKKES